MKHYTSSRVLSLRIDEALLRAVQNRARAEGRSVSGQIVFFVREQVEREEKPSKRPEKISDWLAHRKVFATHAEFRRARGTASAKLTQAAARKARRK